MWVKSGSRGAEPLLTEAFPWLEMWHLSLHMDFDVSTRIVIGAGLMELRLLIIAVTCSLSWRWDRPLPSLVQACSKEVIAVLNSVAERRQSWKAEKLGSRGLAG